MPNDTKTIDPSTCDPRDIGLKSFFLGPQSENAAWFFELVEGVFARWFDWRKSLYPADGRAISPSDQGLAEFSERQKRFKDVLTDLLVEFEGEVAKFSPRYAGHMFSEISLPALLGHISALLHNPNNVSEESAKVGVEVERRAILELINMIGFPREACGHFTSGGTVANFEAIHRAKTRYALWLAVGANLSPSDSIQSVFHASHIGWSRCLQYLGEHKSDQSHLTPYNVLNSNPFDAARRLELVYGRAFKGPILLAPASSHYSWKKGAMAFGCGRDDLWSVAVDRYGRLDLQDLERKITIAEKEDRPILMVVSVAGTTEMGQFDPVDEVQDLLDHLASQRGLHLWHHVDAAYGGFFASMNSKDAEISQAFSDSLDALPRVNSITLDPHKLAYVPYASGVVLVKDPREYYLSAHGAPYVQFSKIDAGPYTLEGSRPATGAAATWVTSQVIGLNDSGYGRILARTIAIRKKLERDLLASNIGIVVAPGCESNVLCFLLATKGERLSISNARTKRIYEDLGPKGHGPFVVAKTTVYRERAEAYFDSLSKDWESVADESEIVLIRMCLLNPFFNAKEMNFKFSDEFISVLKSYAP